MADEMAERDSAVILYLDRFPKAKTTLKYCAYYSCVYFSGFIDIVGTLEWLNYSISVRCHFILSPWLDGFSTEIVLTFEKVILMQF
jgi:hypothetical protein